MFLIMDTFADAPKKIKVTNTVEPFFTSAFVFVERDSKLASLFFHLMKLLRPSICGQSTPTLVDTVCDFYDVENNH